MTDAAQQIEAPVIPNVPGQGFHVPPAGDSLQQVGVPTGNVPAVALPGQQPGFVKQQQAPVQPAPQQAQPATASPEMQQVLSLLQAQIAQQTASPGLTGPITGADDLNTLDPATIEDPALRSMAYALRVAGPDIDFNRALGNAIKHGDPGLIDVHYLTEKGGANSKALIEMAKGVVQAVEGQAKATSDRIMQSVGGEQAWQTSVAAFNSRAPQELRTTVAQMLNSGKENLIQAGAKIVQQFGQQSGLIPQIGTAPILNTAATSGTGQALDKVGFQTALQKLDRNAPNYEQSREELFNRRRMGKQLGL